MNDRGRLAADLASEIHVDEAHGFPPGYTAADLADRLIALGWTTLEEVHRRLHPSHPPLPVCQYAGCSFAKAYREDAG